MRSLEVSVARVLVGVAIATLRAWRRLAHPLERARPGAQLARRLAARAGATR